MEVKKDHDNNMKHEINHNNIKEEELEILKKRISSHPLYSILLHSHLNCLKVFSGEFDSPETMNTEDSDEIVLTKLSLQATSSELDQFMEAYCSTLRELKEAMEKSLVETQRFVDDVYTQLNDIVLSSST